MKRSLINLKKTTNLKPHLKTLIPVQENLNPLLHICILLGQTIKLNKAIEEETKVTPKKKVIIIGGGPNRIGQGIEFDYCCVHSSFAVKEMDVESIMINCNPETVSTDFDISDRLYFEPLDFESVLEICMAENRFGNLTGVIVQLGGQTPLKLAERINKKKLKS